MSSITGVMCCTPEVKRGSGNNKQRNGFEQGRTGEEDVTGNIRLFFPANGGRRTAGDGKGLRGGKTPGVGGDFLGNENFEYYAVASMIWFRRIRRGLGKVESDVRFRDLGYPSNPQQEAAERDSSYCFHISFDDGEMPRWNFFWETASSRRMGDICPLPIS